MKNLIYTSIFAILLSSCNISPKEINTASENITQNTDYNEATSENNNFKEIASEKKTKNNAHTADNSLAVSSKKELPENVQKVNFSKFLPQTQEFTFYPDKEQLIKLESGTKFFIPAHSFSGNSPLTIKVNEFFSKEDAFMRGLTTMTTEGEILESAGMFHVEVFSGADKIDLRPGAEIIIETAEPVAEDMGIYYGVGNSNGDILWDFDSLGKTANPVIVLEKGKFKNTADKIFAEQYKVDKETALKLMGQKWTTSASFNREGKMTGQTLCSGRKEPKDKACEAFFDLISQLDKEVFQSNFQQYSIDFQFSCISREEYIQRVNEEKALSEMEKAFKGFNKTYDDGRKYFSIRSLGFINIDQKFPVPDFKDREDIFVKATESALETVKLVFSDNNSILSPKLENGYFVFKKIPVGTEINIVAAYAKGDKIYSASEKMTVKKRDNRTDLAYSANNPDDFAAKIAELCN